MLRKRRVIVLPVAFSLLCLMFSNVASAKAIDPCWYGCPKDGCPQCDKGGGPIKARDNKALVKNCEKNHLARVEDCKNYHSDKDQAKKKECLAKDKALFDACIKNH